METFTIHAEKDTPEIELNGESGLFYFSGKSFPVSINSFFTPVIEYFETYCKNPQKNTTIEFKWSHFNSSTFKIILKIISILKNASSQIVIKWYYSKENEFLKDKANEIKEVLDVNIQIIETTD